MNDGDRAYQITRIGAVPIPKCEARFYRSLCLTANGVRCSRCEHVRGKNNCKQVALGVLHRIDELSREQMTAMRDADYKRVLKLDKQMERQFGKRERALVRYSIIAASTAARSTQE